jgi:hypothetical protein
MLHLINFISQCHGCFLASKLRATISTAADGAVCCCMHYSSHAQLTQAPSHAAAGCVYGAKYGSCPTCSYLFLVLRAAGAFRPATMGRSLAAAPLPLITSISCLAALP